MINLDILFSKSFNEQMSNIHGEILKIMKYDDKYHIKKSIQNKGRTAYGEDGHTQVINRIFRIVQSDPKNEGFLEEPRKSLSSGYMTNREQCQMKKCAYTGILI